LALPLAMAATLVARLRRIILLYVMLGLVPGIQPTTSAEQVAKWIPATSAGMTTYDPSDSHH